MAILTEEEMYEHLEAAGALPPIPEHWRLHLYPSTAGALLRFGVSFTGLPLSLGRGRVSVYFDVLDKLGWVGSPYWELYPDCNDSNSRFLRGEEKELFEAIENSLLQQEMKRLESSK